MAKEFARMLRTQTNEFGTWHAGTVYGVTPRTAAKFEAYCEKGFAEPVSEKAFKAEIAAAAKADKDAIAADKAEDAAGEDEGAK